jgi:hypothetical protein
MHRRGEKRGRGCMYVFMVAEGVCGAGRMK